jgi:molecular chaperone IbpA
VSKIFVIDLELSLPSTKSVGRRAPNRPGAGVVPVFRRPLYPCCSMEDVAMRNLNLDPFWRTSIGFDRLFDLMDESLRFEPEDHYPPCNIVRTGEDSYRISLAVAGFTPDQLNVTVDQNMLVVTGKANEKQGEGEYLYKGIAGRSFERRFNLADYVVVKGASVNEGLLQIELERELPEAMKPRRVDIKSGKAIGQGDKVPDHRAFQGCLNETQNLATEVVRAVTAEPPL